VRILLVMKFWTDGQENSTRFRNVQYCYPKMINLDKYLKSKGIKCEVKIYDFSPIKIIEGSIHIPYELGEYRKAEKTNLILKNNMNSFDFIFMFDSDTFFVEEDYPKIFEIVNQLKKRDIVTFDAAKLHEDSVFKIEEGVKFNLYDEDWWYAYSGHKINGPLAFGMGGGLGGVYICDIELLVESGGFNEDIVGWGAEDGDMINRIIHSGKPYSFKPQRDFAPFHLPHFVDRENEKYSKRYLHERTKI